MSASSQPEYFVYRRRVTFYETDAMGVVHHSNHIKYFEEARVEWMREKGLIQLHHPYGPYVFAVVKLENRYFKPARFDDEMEVWLQGRLSGAKIELRYALWSERLQAVIGDGSTTLVPVTEDLEATKLPLAVRSKFNEGPWSEVWPPTART